MSAARFVIIAATVLQASCGSRDPSVLVKHVARTPVPTALYKSPIGSNQIRVFVPDQCDGLWFTVFDSSMNIVDRGYTLTTSNPTVDGRVYLGQGGAVTIFLPKNQNSCALALRANYSLTKVFSLDGINAGKDLENVRFIFGDMNGDDRITPVDIEIIRHFFGHNTNEVNSREFRVGSVTVDDVDFNKDGKIDQADIDYIVPNVGKTGDCLTKSMSCQLDRT